MHGDDAVQAWRAGPGAQTCCETLDALGAWRADAKGGVLCPPGCEGGVEACCLWVLGGRDGWVVVIFLGAAGGDWRVFGE